MPCVTTAAGQALLHGLEVANQPHNRTLRVRTYARSFSLVSVSVGSEARNPRIWEREPVGDFRLRVWRNDVLAEGFQTAS